MKKQLSHGLGGLLALSLVHCQSAPAPLFDPTDPDSGMSRPVDRPAHSEAILNLEVQHHDRDGNAIPLVKKVSVKPLEFPNFPLKIPDPWDQPPGYYRKEFDNDLGYVVHLEIADINWRSAKFFSEGDSDSAERSFVLDRAENLMAPDLISGLVASGLAPSGSYGDYEIIVGPSTSATQLKLHGNHGNQTNPGQDGLKPGQSFGLRLEGTWFKDKQSGLVKVESLRTVALQGSLGAPLVLEGEGRFCWSTRYDLLFDGVDFQAAAEAEVEGIVLENLRESVGPCPQ